MKYIVIGIAIGFVMTTFFSLAEGDGMDKCQLTHSYDTCFQLFNR